MMVAWSTFSRKLLTRNVVVFNKVLSQLYSKNGQNEVEVGKSRHEMLGYSNEPIVTECCKQRAFLSTSTTTNGRKDLDFSRVPHVKEEDLEEAFVRGSGPGGQAVNKTNNCVVLTHKPTGIVVKCHESRLQEKNRNLAREMLRTKLDNHLNGELSIEAQKAALQRKKNNDRASKRKKLAAMKEKWRQSMVSVDENS